MQFFQSNLTFFHKIFCIYIGIAFKSYYCNSELNLKFCENLNFITFDKRNINLGKTYAKLRIFPKIFENRSPGFQVSEIEDCLKLFF